MNNLKWLVQTLFVLFFPGTPAEFHLWVYRRNSLLKTLAFSIYKQVSDSMWRNSLWTVDWAGSVPGSVPFSHCSLDDGDLLPKPPLLADITSSVSTSIAISSPLCFCCWLEGLFSDAQGTETFYLLQTMFWGEATFQTLQGPAFLKNYTPTTKSVSKTKGDAETLGYHFGSPEQHRGKITRGFWVHMKVCHW